mgnify:CR=1 FL=1
MGTTVEFKANGGSAAGYLAVPARGSGPGLIVIQEWWGLNPQIKRMADRFADAGFVALAPDLYHGESTTEPDEVWLPTSTGPPGVAVRVIAVAPGADQARVADWPASMLPGSAVKSRSPALPPMRTATTAVSEAPRAFRAVSTNSASAVMATLV